jgi:uncharacterized protein (TIGR00369 family)
MTNAADQTAHLELLKNMVLAMPVAQTLQLRFVRIEPGTVELEIPVVTALTYRPGVLQATAVFAAADFAAVASAGTLLPPGFVNATVDTTLKLLAPARGSHVRAVGRVVRAGKTLTVCAADVFAVDGEQQTLCATLLATAQNTELKRS